MTVQRNPSLFLRAMSVLGGLLVGASLSLPVAADDIDEIQRRDLALIQTQIEQIKIVVVRLDARQQQANPETTRVYFDIPRLRADLEAISSGIDAYLAPDRLLPRQPQPLDGDYLDDRGQ
ncbi:RAQPRD family integrative conjugative element protein [Halomonas sp. McH1-25]|uniref:integrative conjugative element protein, RAQPRD family n=1 Tax=unclassified Halomonas TaxID=2609666 RepID=UPI001EF5598F|nr:MULTISPECIES: RAQPRD family integrative conjugative element protein [unclassified Halomonas]MCG7601778.1 RAQPRD family integrative conjugative element protein [Halomonas sp. McH1-25]MCP1343954.1 RAQPRD family integrative conjugative element protein [Halomonas sp. FL8]